MPDISAFCPACGQSVARADRSPATVAADTRPSDSLPRQLAKPTLPSISLGDRLAGAGAYFTFVPAVVFILMRQYRRRSFVRFHAFQSALFYALAFGLLLLGLLGSTFGYLFVWFLLGVLALLAFFFTWVVLTIKALQGERFRLPVGGDLAEHWATGNHH